MKNNIYVISNDKIYRDKDNNLYGPNNDLDNILHSLKSKFKVHLIARKTKIKNKFRLGRIEIFEKKNLIKNMKIFMISLTPYNFFMLIYFLYIKRVSVTGHIYFRSDGFLEYKYRYGWFGYFVYFLMFTLIKKKLNFISCSKNFTNIDCNSIVYPSECDEEWFLNRKSPKLDKIYFLYVGRLTYDKGSEFLRLLFKSQIKKNFKFQIVGIDKKDFSKQQNPSFDFSGIISEKKEMIKIYDQCNIFLLPSYIEGFPKVINECLARHRPVIIFNEISYVVNEREGIFKCERDIDDLFNLSNYIIDNYQMIQDKIRSNKDYTKLTFQKDLSEKI